MSLLVQEKRERGSGAEQSLLTATLPRLEVQFDPVINMNEPIHVTHSRH